MLFSQQDLPHSWRPLFRELSYLGWDLDSAVEDVPEWASRPTLVFVNQSGHALYLCFFQLPLWCGNTRQSNGLTIVGLSHQLPLSQEEAESHSLPLEANWQEALPAFLAPFQATPYRIPYSAPGTC